MFVLNTSSPAAWRRDPKNAPPTTVPSSRTREPSIRWTPPPFPGRILGFASAAFSTGPRWGARAPAGRCGDPRGVGMVRHVRGGHRHRDEGRRGAHSRLPAARGGDRFPRGPGGNDWMLRVYGRGVEHSGPEGIRWVGMDVLLLPGGG